MPIPTSLVFIILGIIGLFIYFFQNKKQNKLTWIYLLLGIILILLGIIPGILISLQNNYPKNQIECEKFNEVECLENQDFCSLCSESITSSYIGCHSIEFCKNTLNKVTGEGEVLDGMTQRDQVIKKYLVSQKHFSWKTVENSKNFCVFENLDSENEIFPLYLWVRCGEFIMENGEIKEESGISGPIKIDYPNELSFYDLERFSYEVAGNGSSYSKDIKRIFPLKIQEKIFNFSSENINEKIREVVKNNF
ncbi:MAG: DUF308 domain-containing protein [Candidatus Shapirobacteria bacterium]|jgi:hypothetical protein